MINSVTKDLNYTIKQAKQMKAYELAIEKAGLGGDTWPEYPKQLKPNRFEQAVIDSRNGLQVMTMKTNHNRVVENFSG